MEHEPLGAVTVGEHTFCLTRATARVVHYIAPLAMYDHIHLKDIPNETQTFIFKALMNAPGPFDTLEQHFATFSFPWVNNECVVDEEVQQAFDTNLAANIPDELS